MNTSYKVHIWKLQTRYRIRKGKKEPERFVVRWTVGKERCRFHQSFRNRAQADSYRSELLSAARRGEAFSLETGLPSSASRTVDPQDWFEFAQRYAEMKWEGSSSNSRKSTADSLIAITLAMLRDTATRPPTKHMSLALRRAFNKHRRDEEHPEHLDSALTWLRGNTRPVGELARPDCLRAVLQALEKNQSGGVSAHDTIRLRRTTLCNALDFAVEQGQLDENPLGKVKVKKHTATLRPVDTRRVVNPVQARTLLRAVHETEPRLYAFFALMYFAALRPEEAANLRKENLSLPAKGLGEIHLQLAAPDVAADWTDDRKKGEQRSLKHREDGSGRTVPCTDELTEILHAHLEQFGTAADGRLFRGRRDGSHLSSTVYGRVWAQARGVALTDEVTASPLAKRPYDLRHAAVSTWLNATNDPVRVAAWAGHSVAVLLRVYAKCLDASERQARERIGALLKGI